MKATIKDGKLVVELPLISPPRPSGSGRTLLVATTGGNKETELLVNGQAVHVGVNAYVYATPKEATSARAGAGSSKGGS